MKYYVRVCRPRFEIAILEFEAPDFSEAEAKAVELAMDLPSVKWTTLTFDDGDYVPHIENCMPDSDVDANSSTPDDRVALLAEFRDVHEDQGTRYLFLMADVEDGEGEVISEPWFHGEDPELLETDIAGDWVTALEMVADNSWIDYIRWPDSDAKSTLEEFMQARRKSKRRGRRPPEETD